MNVNIFGMFVICFCPYNSTTQSLVIMCSHIHVLSNNSYRASGTWTLYLLHSEHVALVLYTVCITDIHYPIAVDMVPVLYQSLNSGILFSFCL